MLKTNSWWKLRVQCTGLLSANRSCNDSFEILAVWPRVPKGHGWKSSAIIPDPLYFFSWTDQLVDAIFMSGQQMKVSSYLLAISSTGNF